jgi:hypothetical protein
MTFSPRTLHAWSEASIDSARVVLPLVTGLVRPASAVDVGCLFGAWAAVARELGVRDLAAVDGGYVDRAELLVPEHRFIAHDLARPLRLGRRFDLALCLEVAHYLPQARAAGLVADLCALAPVVLFSAAIPRQGGLGHVNEQWPAYWAKRFVAHGYAPVDCVRDEVWDDPRVAPWYAQNALLFVASEAAGPLRGHHGYGRCPARVHPAVFMTYADGRYQAVRRRMARGVATLRRA